MNGFVNILKPPFFSSSDVVVIVRGVLKRALGSKLKVGHTGTLDPLGSGVLPIAVGSATKLFDIMQSKKKIYRAAFKFGILTDTLDSMGVVISRDSIKISLDDVNAVLPSFFGEIMQIPPSYSAISINGKRAYDLARKGENVELSARKITIYSIKCVDQIDDNEFVFDIECSSGTYIRSLARDIAQALGTVAYMSYIIRLKSGNFLIENAVTLDEFKLNPLKHVESLENFEFDFETLMLENEKQYTRFRNGVPIATETKNGLKSVNYHDKLIAVGEVLDGVLRSKITFFED